MLKGKKSDILFIVNRKGGVKMSEKVLEIEKINEKLTERDLSLIHI